jgi:argininosuccinate lyase
MGETTALFATVASVTKTLVFNEQRALDEVNADYSTTTELADTLQREAELPFRVGHHFASALVDYGRGHHLRPSEIPYAEAQRIYATAATQLDIAGAVLPLSEAQFRRALKPENMVQSSKGLGGPQPAEVARMLANEQALLAADRAWLEATHGKLHAASLALDAAFAQLRDRS